MSKLFSLACVMVKREGSAMTFHPRLGIQSAENEDEAMGIFVKTGRELDPLFHIEGDIIVLEITKGILP